MEPGCANEAFLGQFRGGSGQQNCIFSEQTPRWSTYYCSSMPQSWSLLVHPSTRLFSKSRDENTERKIALHELHKRYRYEGTRFFFQGWCDLTLLSSCRIFQKCTSRSFRWNARMFTCQTLWIASRRSSPISTKYVQKGVLCSTRFSCCESEKWADNKTFFFSSFARSARYLCCK